MAATCSTITTAASYIVLVAGFIALWTRIGRPWSKENQLRQALSERDEVRQRLTIQECELQKKQQWGEFLGERLLKDHETSLQEMHDKQTELDTKTVQILQVKQSSDTQAAKIKALERMNRNLADARKVLLNKHYVDGVDIGFTDLLNMRDTEIKRLRAALQHGNKDERVREREELILSLEAQIRGLRAFATTNETLETHLRTARKESRGLKEEFEARIGAEKRVFDEETQALRREVAVLQYKKNTQIASIDNAKITALQAQNAELTELVSNLTQYRDWAENAGTYLEQALQQQTASRAEVEQELEALKGQQEHRIATNNKKCKDEKNILRTKIVALEQQNHASALDNNKIATLQAEIRTLNDGIKARDAANTNLDAQVVTLIQQRDAANNTASELDTQLREAKTENGMLKACKTNTNQHAGDLAQKDHRVQELQATIDYQHEHINKHMADANHIVADLRSRLHAFEAQADVGNHSLLDLEKQIQVQKNKVAVSHVEIENLRTEVGDKRDLIADLRAKNAAAISASSNQAMARERRQLEDQIRDMNLKVQKMERAAQAQNKQTKDMILSRIEENKRNLAKKQQEIELLKDNKELDTLKAVVAQQDAYIRSVRENGRKTWKDLLKEKETALKGKEKELRLAEQIAKNAKRSLVAYKRDQIPRQSDGDTVMGEESQLKTSLADYEEKVQKLETENDKLRAERDKFECKFRNLDIESLFWDFEE